MASDLTAQTLLQFVTGDFETAWDAIGAVADPASRRNSMLGKQTMVLLELASRLCQIDGTGAALATFPQELKREIPGTFVPFQDLFGLRSAWLSCFTYHR